VYHYYDNLLGNVYSKFIGPNNPYRGEKVVITILSRPIVVVNCGGNTMGNKWEIVVRGLSPSSNVTDILTFPRKLTYLFINNSPLSYCQEGFIKSY
jgi:hypothetical protein